MTARPPADFFVVGAARSGTTSLHYYLDQHPAVAMSTVKEPNYFLFERRDGRVVPLIHDERIILRSVKAADDYRRLFPAGDALRGDASPLYLYTERTPALIRAAAPEASIIAVLRHPVARAWSHFLYTYKGRPEEANDRFSTAVEPELADARYSPYQGGTHFLRLGLYAGQVERYLRTFGPERCLFLLQDELRADTAAAFDQVVEFLGLWPHAVDTSRRYNQSSVAASTSTRVVRDLLRTVQPYVKRVLPKPVARILGRARASKVPTRGTGLTMHPATADRLAEFFADDIRRTERLVGRSLAGWHATWRSDKAG